MYGKKKLPKNIQYALINTPNSVTPFAPPISTNQEPSASNYRSTYQNKLWAPIHNTHASLLVDHCDHCSF